MAESPSPEASPSPVASPIIAKLTITRLPFHLGEVGIGYLAVALSASGGVQPYRWSISSGVLPPGLALSANGFASGKPTKAGTFRFSVQVTDSAGGTASGSGSIFVFKPIAFTTLSAICTGDQTTGCTTTLKYSGGASSAAPKLTVKLNAGDPTLPPGSSFTAKNGVVTVVIKPQCNAFTATATLVLADPSPLCSSGFKCSSSPARVAITQTQSC